MDIQRDLKRLIHLQWNTEVFSKLMNLQPECPTSICDRTIKPAPTGDRGEAVLISFPAYRPLVQHYRLPRWTPSNVLYRNTTIISPDVFPDREVMAMTFQPRCSATRCMPKLSKTRIEIDIGLPSN